MRGWLEAVLGRAAIWFDKIGESNGDAATAVTLSIPYKVVLIIAIFKYPRRDEAVP